METFKEIIGASNAVWEQILSQPAHVLLIAVLNVVGCMLKRSPVPNHLIPWVIVGGGTIGYPFVAGPGTVSPDHPNPAAVLVLFGILLGFGAWILHRLLLKRISRLLPEWAQGALTGNTEMLTKPPAGTTLLLILAALGLG